MKARLPYEYRRGADGARRRAVAAAMLLFAKALNEYGFSANRINEWSCVFDETLKEVAGMYSERGYSNKTWGEEAEYWADTHGLNIPKSNYLLIIEGVIPARGPQRLLLISELYTLTKMGYGDKRLNDILAVYADISRLYTGGRAKYSKKALEAWADEKGVIYHE